MARIAGVDLPRDKRLDIALTYIYGIGTTSAYKIVDGTGIDAATKVRDLSEDEVAPDPRVHRPEPQGRG